MAVKFKQRQTSFIVKPFNYEVQVVLTTDVTESGTRLGIPPSQNFYAYHAPASNCLHSAIILPFGAGAGTVAHEAYHCVCSIFERIGAKQHDEEVVAYTLTYIVEKIATFIKGKPRKKAARKKKK